MSRIKRFCKLILVSATYLLLPSSPALAQRVSYLGTYANAAGDDGVSDTLFAEMEIFDGRFSLRFATREEVRESGRTGRPPYKQFYGTWEVDTVAKTLDITYYRPATKGGEPPAENTERYTAADGKMVVLRFKGGREVRGIFTSKHFPELPPALCLAWGSGKNLVFTNWSQRKDRGLLIRRRSE